MEHSGPSLLETAVDTTAATNQAELPTTMVQQASEKPLPEVEGSRGSGWSRGGSEEAKSGGVKGGFGPNMEDL